MLCLSLVLYCTGENSIKFKNKCKYVENLDKMDNIHIYSKQEVFFSMRK